ncbi:MAG: hypothetical protein CMJ64_16365 [Planctomycetaceae bacterium]|nr:hypothetical protein [Planctomycetaceae bacterium]
MSRSSCQRIARLRTYQSLFPLVAKALDEANLSAEIIIVDDNSPDETPDVCERLAQDYPLRLIVRRSERGLSSAVIHGMKQARGEVLVVLDADLSHPPEKVPELAAAIAGDSADFVIGSRYVPGGKTDGDWGLFRWLNSKVATLLALPLTSARDPMAGFFALRRSTFEGAQSLDPIGYKIGLELIVKTGCRRIAEIPIRFRDRLYGESKLSLKEQINYLRHLRRLYVFKLGWLAKPLQFVLIGSTGMVVDLASYALLLSIASVSVARAVAIGVAMTWNFLLNRRLTFSESRGNLLIKQYVLFCAACSVGAGVNWALSVGLCEWFEFFTNAKLFAAFLGVIAGTGFNYVLSSRVVFRTHKASAGTD